MPWCKLRPAIPENVSDILSKLAHSNTWCPILLDGALSSPAMPWWLKTPSDTLWCPMAPSDALVPEARCPQVPPSAPRCPPLVSIGEALCQPGVSLTLRPCLPRVSKSLEIPSAITTFYTLHPTPASCHVVEHIVCSHIETIRESPHHLIHIPDPIPHSSTVCSLACVLSPKWIYPSHLCVLNLFTLTSTFLHIQCILLTECQLGKIQMIE